MTVCLFHWSCPNHLGSHFFVKTRLEHVPLSVIDNVVKWTSAFCSPLANLFKSETVVCGIVLLVSYSGTCRRPGLFWQNGVCVVTPLVDVAVWLTSQYETSVCAVSAAVLCTPAVQFNPFGGNRVDWVNWRQPAELWNGECSSFCPHLTVPFVKIKINWTAPNVFIVSSCNLALLSQLTSSCRISRIPPDSVD